MLDRIIAEKWLTARAVFGFFPANAVGDDIELYADEERTEVRATLHNLRQQGEHREGVPNRSLGDFVAPRETGLADHVGAFAVTAGHRRRGADQAVQGRARRLLRDPAGVAGRPARRGLRRAAARAGAHGVLGVRGRRGARQRVAHRRALPRHPARAGLPGLPRAHREAHPVGAAGRRGQHRHPAHRVAWRCGRVPRCPGSTSPTRSRSTSWWAGSAATRSPTTPNARAGPWREAERWLSANLGYDPED